MNRTEVSRVLASPLTIASDRAITWIATGFILSLLIFFMLFPVYNILKLSFLKEGVFTLKNYITYFTTPRIFRSLTNSLFVSIVTVIITTPLALFFAYALTRTTIRGKGVFYTISTLPLIAPSIIQALALILLFGRNGLITRYLLQTDWNIYGATGIIVAEFLYCFPNALFILYITLSAVDTRLDEAAQSLGASALKTFYKVTLPAAKYGIASAAALVFNLTITDFGVPVVIGGNYSVLATEIYQQVIGMQRFDLGATISVILLIPSVGAFLLNYYLTKKSYALISGQARPFLQPSRPFKKWAFTIYCSLISSFVLLIFATVFIGSFVNVWPYDFSLTLKHFDFPSLGGYASIWTSFWIAIFVAILGASFTLLTGYLVEKKKPRGEQLLYILSVMPAAIPGTVMGLGYILAFNKPYFFIYGTPWIIIINIVICNFTLGVLSNISNLKQIDKSVEEAATSLGAGPITTFTRVVFPLCKTAFLSNAIFFFMRAMTTISAVIFLVSAKVHLAAIEIIFLDIDGRTASANAMATVIIAIVVGMIILLRIITGKSGSGWMSPST